MEEAVVTMEEAVVTMEEAVVIMQEAVVTMEEAVVTMEEAVVTMEEAVVIIEEAVFCVCRERKNSLQKITSFLQLTILEISGYVTALETNAGRKRWGKLEIPEKTRRLTASSATITTCENLGVTPPGIETGSPWWEASSRHSNIPAAVMNVDENLRVGRLAPCSTQPPRPSSQNRKFTLFCFPRGAGRALVSVYRSPRSSFVLSGRPDSGGDLRPGGLFLILAEGGGGMTEGGGWRGGGPVAGQREAACRDGAPTWPRRRSSSRAIKTNPARWRRHCSLVGARRVMSACRQFSVAANARCTCDCSSLIPIKAVHDKVSTFEINLRKKSLPLAACILTGALSDIRPLGSPLVDDWPIMNVVKYRVVSGVVWTNRTTVSSNTDSNRTGVLAAVDIAKSKYIHRIRLERASQKQSSDTHTTPCDRVKLCRERKGVRARQRRRIHAEQTAVSPT
ncbi:hypothetical protein PR048_022825 [Dryococelus australis]|uniref:Uncharacterized protein n=1 Tax=Dryococelus australis TaxID=614101 RepID=A0ABQ9GSG0_9NEOP|nr:hypothetical protein PR048_022825 [Dryococelus australis]